MVAASGKDGVIYAVRAADLSPVWERQIGVRCGCPQCGCGSVSSPAFDGEVLYAAGGGADPQNYRNGTVYALNPSTGLTIWSVSLPGVVLAPVTVANGIVFVASTAGLVALDALHGTPLWNQPPGFGSLYSQAVVTGGTVYCTYLDGAFIAWRLP
jgi:outer membrane protein assembly factor BamB